MEYWAGPKFDYDDLDKVAKGQPEARSAAVFLEWVGPWGVEVRQSEEDPVSFFPWSAVIRMEDVPATKWNKISRKIRKKAAQRSCPSILAPTPYRLTVSDDV